MSRRRHEGGSITPLVIGFAALVAMLVAVVVDASAAYLRREGLDSLADAAALAATDGLQGDSVYTHGLGKRAEIDPEAARRYVEDYLRSSDALGRYPGVTWSVSTSQTAVLVRIAAPLRLPLRVPGVGESATITGTAAAVVVVGD
ncbi:MAG TPA: pilus assembly protein TadG-related protein [Marmoricola sp.]|nr:pilus assembly protein TadG-related protein [Marmoricola sp.]